MRQGLLVNDTEDESSLSAAAAVAAESLVPGPPVLPSSSTANFLPQAANPFYARAGTGTFFGSVANLVNAAVGAGMLSLPFALQHSGLLLGCILLLVLGLLSCLSLHVIGRAQKQTDSRTYQECVAKVLGERARIIVTYGQLVFFVGICVAFLDITPDQLAPVFSQWVGHDSPLARRELIIVMIAVVVLLPLMFLKNIQKLSPLATFSVVAVSYTSCVFVARAASQLAANGWPAFTLLEPPENSGDAAAVSLFCVSVSMFKSLPLYSSAYFVHTTYPLVFAELNTRKLTRSRTSMDLAAGLCVAICFVIYVMVGGSGYLYGASAAVGDIPGDALVMFPNGADVVIARFCIAISVSASYLTLHFTSSKCLEDLVLPIGSEGFSGKQRSVEVLLFLSTTVGISMVVKDLDVVLGVMGSVTVIPIMFILPGFMLLKLDLKSTCLFSIKSRFAAYTLIGCGICMAVAGLAVTLDSKL